MRAFLNTASGRAFGQEIDVVRQANSTTTDIIRRENRTGFRRLLKYFSSEEFFMQFRVFQHCAIEDIFRPVWKWLMT